MVQIYTTKVAQTRTNEAKSRFLRRQKQYFAMQFVGILVPTAVVVIVLAFGIQANGGGKDFTAMAGIGVICTGLLGTSFHCRRIVQQLDEAIDLLDIRLTRFERIEQEAPRGDPPDPSEVARFNELVEREFDLGVPGASLQENSIRDTSSRRRRKRKDTDL